jgi:hypothetical protein
MGDMSHQGTALIRYLQRSSQRFKPRKPDGHGHVQTSYRYGTYLPTYLPTYPYLPLPYLTVHYSVHVPGKMVAKTKRVISGLLVRNYSGNAAPNFPPDTLPSVVSTLN